MFGKGNGGGGSSTRMGKMKAGGGSTRTGKMNALDSNQHSMTATKGVHPTKKGDPKISGHGGNVKAGKYHVC